MAELWRNGVAGGVKISARIKWRVGGVSMAWQCNAGLSMKSMKYESGGGKHMSNNGVNIEIWRRHHQKNENNERRRRVNINVS